MKKEMIGKKFGNWLVLEETKKRDKQHGTIKYLCLCDCGRLQVVNGYSLRKGISKYCTSCKNSKRFPNSFRKNNIRLSNIYNGMINRCYYKNNVQYKNYGGRGIKICDEWLNDKMLFYNWAMNNGYQDNLTIDRIDVNSNYEPSNCRWITIQEQAYNKTTSRFILYNGEKKTLAEWAKELGMSQQKLRYRLNHWNIEQAFNK